MRVAVVLVVLVAACDVFGPYRGPPDGGADGAVETDGFAVDSGADADDGASPQPQQGELLTNGGFDVAGARCGPGWDAYGGVIASGTGFVGTGCHPCRSGAAADWFGVTARPLAAAKGPGTFRLDGLHRSGAGVERCEIGLNITSPSGPTRQVAAPGCVAARGDWQELALTTTLAAGEEIIEVYGGSFAVDGTCFDIDQLTLSKL